MIANALSNLNVGRVGRIYTAAPLVFTFDDFGSRSESPIGTPYESVGANTVHLAGGFAVGDGGAAEFRVRTSWGAFNPNQRATIDLGTTTSGVAASVRVASNGDCYYAYMNSTTSIGVWKRYAGGSFAQIDPGGTPGITALVPNDKYSLEATGAGPVTLIVRKNGGAALFTITDDGASYGGAVLTTGQIGALLNSGQSISGFGGEDI